MERHRCKICCRKFANGRALGGHMRSHMMNLPNVPKPSNETESWPELSPVLPSPSSSSSSSSSSDDDDDKDEEELGETEKGLACKLRENPRKSTKFTDHNNNAEFSSFGSSSVSVTEDLDREETEFEHEFESESSKQHNNPTKKRSKRRRQRNQKQPPIETTSSLSPSPESSVSEVTSEEDVALCLMMLSRDNWKCSAAKKDDRFTCLTCHKVFRSYQALGGHRASHKKIRPENHPQPGSGSDPSKQRKTHECPVCFRVFASAQALGGHKRTHSSTTTAAGGCGGTDGVHGGASESNGFGESPRKKMNAFIDLNLPAPVYDHDDEISQVSLSAVSDPHFS